MTIFNLNILTNKIGKNCENALVSKHTRTQSKSTTQYNTAKTLFICDLFRAYGTHHANAERGLALLCSVVDLH